MPLRFIKAAPKAKIAAPQLVTYHLHKRLAGARPARATHTVHASEVTHSERAFCPREYALLDQTKLTRRPEFLTTSQRLTFAIGHMVQAFIIESLGELAVTDWVCAVCGHKAVLQRRPVYCPDCEAGGDMLKAEEHRWQSSVSGISCGIDTHVLLPDTDKLRVVEVKTIKEDELKKLAAPLAEHRLRTQLYLRCVAESSSPLAAQVDVSVGHVVYVAKGTYGIYDPVAASWGLSAGKFTPFREFIVERNDAATETLVQRAIALREFRAGGPLPAGVCPSAVVPRACACPVVHQCFAHLGGCDGEKVSESVGD